MRPIATLKMGDNDKENDITKDNNNQPSSGKMKETCFIFNTFSDQSLESLYQSFTVKQKKAGLECFVVTSFLFDVYTLAVSKFSSKCVEKKHCFSSQKCFLPNRNC